MHGWINVRRVCLVSMLPDATLQVGSQYIWFETIHSLGGRDINFGAETMFAFDVFTFHILKRTSDIVADSSYP